LEWLFWHHLRQVQNCKHTQSNINQPKTSTATTQNLRDCTNTVDFEQTSAPPALFVEAWWQKRRGLKHGRRPTEMPWNVQAFFLSFFVVAWLGS
jgi:hypothetical protein